MGRQTVSMLTANMLASPSLSDVSPYDSRLRMDVLNMLRAWYKLIAHTGKDNAEPHPHLQKVFKEVRSLHGGLELFAGMMGAE